MRASIVIRTFNEERHVGAVLEAIARQDAPEAPEVVLVDSGSTDRTLAIAQAAGCRIVPIAREAFTFGRSLNHGCAAATGDALVFLSGHCIPVERHWLTRLLAPLEQGHAVYSYGRQIGDDSSRYSERRLLAQNFPLASRIPQEGAFCNNANAALRRDVWATAPFDESLTGLEDLELAGRLVRQGARIAYVADAAVYHLHDESWRQIKNRFEREAIALQKIMPQVHIHFSDFLRYFTSAVALDLHAAWREGVLLRRWREIVAYRCMQFWGSYCGNNEHRKLSREMKEKYFFPR